MRIGFTGAQGTGKTSVLKKVEEKKEFVVVPSTARAALEAGYKVNRDATPLSQLVTTVGRIGTEDHLHRLHGNTVSDRTPLDSLAYTTYQFNNIWAEYDKNKYYWAASVDLVTEHMHKYDLIVYFPVYWAPKDDGVRDPNVEYQEAIDGHIKLFLTTMELDYVVMPNASSTDRYKFLINAIKSI